MVPDDRGRNLVVTGLSHGLAASLSAAASPGVRLGDRLVELNGRRLTGLPVSEHMERLRAATWPLTISFEDGGFDKDAPAPKVWRCGACMQL